MTTNQHYHRGLIPLREVAVYVYSQQRTAYSVSRGGFGRVVHRAQLNSWAFYFGGTSPNIKGMVTDGATIQEAAIHAEDAIATMISDMAKYPEAQDPTKWDLKDNESIMWVTVNMAKWLNQYGKTVRRNISIPEGLNNWAKANKINVSQVTANALREMQEA